MTKGVVKKVRPEVAAELAVEEFRTILEAVLKDGRVGKYELLLVHNAEGQLKLFYRPSYQRPVKNRLDIGK